jgi:hypothetical protein
MPPIVVSDPMMTLQHLALVHGFAFVVSYNRQTWTALAFFSDRPMIRIDGVPSLRAAVNSLEEAIR